jgi:putative redox protein
MPIETVHAEWIRDRVFLLRDRFDFPVVMTQPQGVNGADLLPLSLIGCSAWDVMDILQKQRQEVTDLQVSAESERDESPPWRFRRIRLLYRVTGRDLSPDLVRRAIELSETRYCSIFATLRDVVELTSEYQILDADQGADGG